MKKTLSILAAAVMLLSGTMAAAQPQIGAGYLNSTENSSYNGNKMDPVNSNGFYVGLSYNIPIVAGLGVAPGLYYSMLGSKSTGGFDLGRILHTSGETTFTEHALNIPVLLNYGFDLAPDFRFFVYGGPTLQYGLSSKYVTNGSIDFFGLGGSGSNTLDNYASANSGYNRFNVYLGGGLGMNVAKHIQVTVGYDYGVLNLYKGDEKDNCIRRRSNIKIGLAYLF